MKLSCPYSDETIDCHLFVVAFPFSKYFYAEAFTNEKIHCWVEGIVNSLNYFGGVAKILKPDNCKTATIKPDKYEPKLHTAMIELAEYYKTAVLPARVRKPRDKNVVESSVGFVSRNIIAALRNQKFYSIDDMNKEVFRLTEELNKWKFDKKDGTRFDLFNEIEKETLLPLPLIPFQLYERAMVKVAPDYHIQFDKCFYSVHPKYIGQELQVKASSNEVSVFTKKGEKIATHGRGRFRGQKITDESHIAPAHQSVLGWSGDKFRSEARSIGPNSEILINNVGSSRKDRG